MSRRNSQPSNLGSIAAWVAEQAGIGPRDYTVIDRMDGKGAVLEGWPEDAETTESLLARGKDWLAATEKRKLDLEVVAALDAAKAKRERKFDAAEALKGADLPSAVRAELEKIAKG